MSGARNINDALPVELLCHTFSWFTIDEHIQLARVCRLWRAVIFDLFSRKKSLSFCATSQRLIRENSEVFRSVVSLSIHLSSDNISDLSALLSGMQNLRSLELHASDITQSDFKDIEDSFALISSSLETLEMYSYSHDFPLGILPHIIRTSADSIKHLICCNQELEANFALITSSFKNLETLDLSSCQVGMEIGPSTFSTRLASLPKLRHLNLRDTNICISSSLLKSLGDNCPNLEYFVTSSHINAEASDISHLDNCTNLKEVKADCEVTNFNVNFLSALPSRASLHCSKHLSAPGILQLRVAVTLEVLNIVNNQYLTDDMLQALTATLIRLVKVDMSECQKVTNTGVAALLANLDHVKDIVAAEITNIDADLIQLISIISKERKVTINVRATKLAKQWKEQGQRWGYYGDKGNIQIFS